MESRVLEENTLSLDNLLKSFEESIKQDGIKDYPNDSQIKSNEKRIRKLEKDVKKIAKDSSISTDNQMDALLSIFDKECEQIEKSYPEFIANKKSYLSAGSSYDSTNTRITQEKQDIEKKKALLEQLISKKNELSHGNSKELKEESQKTENYRKELQEKISQIQNERIKKIKKLTFQKEENEKLSSHLEKADAELLKQQNSYNEDCEKKEKGIDEHKEKIYKSLDAKREEIQKLPEFEKEHEDVKLELTNMKEVDAILDGQYKSITEKMGQCDSFFKMISKQMKNMKKQMKQADSDNKKQEDSNELSNQNLIGLIKQNRNLRDRIEEELSKSNKLELLKAKLSNDLISLGN